MIRISVVVIVFNLEDYIEQAILSVLRQTRKADEIIVVDDCSTDLSPMKVKNFGDKVKYLRMPKNSGALLAALHGVSSAGGDVVCMLDGDDYWDTNKLAIVEREFLKDSELLLLSHDHVRVDVNGAELAMRDETHNNIERIRRRARSSSELSEMLKHTVLEQKGFWLGSAYCFRKNLFDAAMFECQIRQFDIEKLRQTYLDLVIAPFLVLTNPSKNVAFSEDTCLFYRIHNKASLAGNFTPEIAIRSALRGRRINELIYEILLRNGASSKLLLRRRSILRHYDYLCALYAENFMKAVQLYAQLAGSHWTWAELKKETIRFVVIGILGPGKFLTLKHR